jgi:hypothetical protein
MVEENTPRRSIMTEETDKPAGMTPGEADILCKCIIGTAKNVVKDTLILKGRCEEAAANAIVISVGLGEEDWRKPVDHCHFFFSPVPTTCRSSPAGAATSFLSRKTTFSSRPAMTALGRKTECAVSGRN